MVSNSSEVKVQHVAVFGAGGSGKSVLISSFYGATQEPAFIRDHSYRVRAVDSGDGTMLRQNYLRMKNTAQVPDSTRYSAPAYQFTINPRQGDSSRGRGVRLVWHDYPGGWFTDEPSSEQERTRRVEAFRKLLVSDVAILLVDGQQILDHRGEEEKYLRDLLWGMREKLEDLRESLLVDGERLVDFPRTWLVALSKSDLHPDLDVQAFRDLVIEKAGADLAELGRTLATFVQTPEAMSVGQDFALLSSAKFKDGRIDVSERVGVDLILPLAIILPLERAVRWSTRFDLPRQALSGLLRDPERVSHLIRAAGLPISKLVGRIPVVGRTLSIIAIPLLERLATAAPDVLQELHERSLQEHDYFTATLTELKIALDAGRTRDQLVTEL